MGCVEEASFKSMATVSECCMGMRESHSHVPRASGLSPEPPRRRCVQGHTRWMEEYKTKGDPDMSRFPKTRAHSSVKKRGLA